MGWSRFLLISFLLLQRSTWAQEAGWQPNQVNATMCQWQEPRGRSFQFQRRVVDISDAVWC